MSQELRSFLIDMLSDIKGVRVIAVDAGNPKEGIMVNMPPFEMMKAVLSGVFVGSGFRVDEYKVGWGEIAALQARKMDDKRWIIK